MSLDGQVYQVSNAKEFFTPTLTRVPKLSQDFSQPFMLEELSEILLSKLTLV
jgi:hypothetical protein